MLHACLHRASAKKSPPPSGRVSNVWHGTRQVCACMSGLRVKIPIRAGILLRGHLLHDKRSPFRPLDLSVGRVDSRVSCMSLARPLCRAYAVLRAHASNSPGSSNERETREVPLRILLSDRIRPSICDQRVSEPRAVGSPVGHHPLIGHTILPLLCWVR